MGKSKSESCDAVTFLAIFALWVAIQVQLLGHPEWTVREAAQKRLSHPLAVLFLPPSSDNPEIAHRLRRLRAEQAKWCDPEYAERVLYRDDFKAWVQAYLVTGKTRIGLEDVFHHMQRYGKEPVVMAVMGAPPDGGWLWYYDTFRAYLDYHWQRAPMPREKGEP